MTEDALDLLDETVTLLRDALAPIASGEARYLALLAANAVATANRQARLGGQEERDPADRLALVQAIRAGEHDDDDDLYVVLLADAARRAWVADPSSLTDHEYATFIGSDGT